MRIPQANVELWAHGIAQQCTASTQDRLQRGAFFRNLYLTGDENGDAAIYNKTFDALEDLNSYLCSTSDLRFKVNCGMAPRLRAMADVVADELLDQLRASNLDTKFEEASRWALIKGKSFVKMLWTVDGLEPYVVQPEFIGVYREDLADLDEQEAFVHSTYITPSQLQMMVANRTDGQKIYERAMKQAVSTRSADAPDQSALLKQVILGGYQPYQGVGGIGAQNPQVTSGMVAWLSGPYPAFDPKVVSQLLRVDELWVKDDEAKDGEGRREWATMIMVGDVMLYGKEQRRNLFAASFDPNNKAPTQGPDHDNPLSCKHPFIEFCPNRLEGYFWGRSEIYNVALLQKQLNTRVNGINRLLRLQENPPKWFQGGGGMDQAKVSKLDKPGGWLSEPDISAKPPVVLAPQLPTGLYESINETEKWFDTMTGMTPTLQGVASPAIRSQGQTDNMTRNATPRFKTKALRVERAIQEAGTLLLLMMKAKCTHTLTAWLMPGGPKPIEAGATPSIPFHEAPADGMTPLEFTFQDLPDKTRVMVDSHSSSPAFGGEALQKAIMLKQAGILPPKEMVDIINPPNRDEIVADLDAAQIAAAAAAARLARLQQEEAAHGKKIGTSRK